MTPIQVWITEGFDQCLWEVLLMVAFFLLGGSTFWGTRTSIEAQCHHLECDDEFIWKRFTVAVGSATDHWNQWPKWSSTKQGHLQCYYQLLCTVLQWQLALLYLERMRKTSRPDVISYTAVLNALSSSERGPIFSPWEQAIELFDRMMSERVSPNVLTYNALLVSCEKASQWQRTLLYFFQFFGSESLKNETTNQNAANSPDVLSLSYSNWLFCDGLTEDHRVSNFLADAQSHIHHENSWICWVIMATLSLFWWIWSEPWLWVFLSTFWIMVHPFEMQDLNQL